MGPHLFEVVTRAKSFALCSNDNYTRGFIGRDRAELALQPPQHCLRQSVERLRAIERQCDHTAGVADSQDKWLFGLGSFRTRR